jgi:AcrR family transcriptional regulator
MRMAADPTAKARAACESRDMNTPVNGCVGVVQCEALRAELCISVHPVPAQGTALSVAASLMSNKPLAAVQQPGEDDARVERSLRALRVAIAELLTERTFSDITVQQIIDRAGVARATFYAHFRNKDDVLYSSYERMFQGMEAHLDRAPSRPPRLAPMAELLTHLGESTTVFASLKASDRLEPIWNLGTDFLADMIERRMEQFGGMPVMDPRLAARMLAGACVEMTKWWLDHPGQLSAQEMDANFHTMARRVCSAPGVVRS